MTQAVVYDAESVTAYDDLDAAKHATGTTWIRLANPDDDTLDRIRELCDIHPLSVEDVRNNVRPKVEDFEEHTFLLVKTARLVRGETTFEEEIDDQPVGLFIGSDWVVTYAPSEPALIQRVFDSVERGDRKTRGRGPDYLAYRVLDAVVDEYFDVLDGIESRIEEIEEEVLDAPDRATLATINDARRELLSMRKLLWPTREAVSTLARGDPAVVEEETEKYFRDVYDHLVQLVDLVETYRDLTTGARDIYLNALSMSTNEVMKKLTVVATILLPLTVVVGVYGMNFEVMPELTWVYGYPAVLLGMVGMSMILVWYFRRQDWV